jgi:hypothetical protein
MVGSGVAADTGDVHQGGGKFIAATKTKASQTPVLRAVISIPPEITEGSVFVVNCLVETTKTASGKPMKGVQGTAAAFANKLNVGAGSWQFFGLVGSGIPFATAKDGTTGLTTGPITAGAWANAPGTNDNISISATFTNNKRVVQTELGCQIEIGAETRTAAR